MLLSPFAIPFPVRTLTRDETNDTEYRVLNPCRKDISRFVTTKIPKAMNAVVAMDLCLMESTISSSSFSFVITITKMPRKKSRYITIEMNLVWV